jgi:YebC/PmpR family DNA-binding regulatory protein
MSGHSKWSTIKRKKGAEDAKRGKIFTRVGRDITIAAREGGGDENSNAKLKLAILKAKAANMPRENIERAVKKGTGELEGGSVDEFTWEGYGTGGIAFIIEVMTDNKNRSLAEVKAVLNRNGGRMAESGSVAWQFKQQAYFEVTGEKIVFDDIFMVAAEAGADDVVEEEGTILVYGPRESFAAIETALTDAKYTVETAELRWFADNESEQDVETSLSNLRLMRKLEDLDDVQSVASNLALTAEVIEAFEEEA